LGLGLALARELVHAHKGTVTAESAGDGLGSTFTVRLPLLSSGDSAVPTRIAPAGEPSVTLFQSRPHVLIVDDEPDAREMLALALETRGANVEHVGSAADAFRSMVEHSPDILLADVGMPGEDGHSLIRRWRHHEDGANARVTAIAVTAYASGADRETALSAGFDRHVAKPIDLDDLVRVIAELQGRDRDSMG
jgi:CheY-like chemotaxis protein